MEILTVVGARPQFIKCAALSSALRLRHNEYLVHTGQHYDDAMSKRFWDEMDLPQADLNLGVGSGSHAVQTAAMLTGLEEILSERKPEGVVAFGDTNSTLAAGLAAAKLNIPVIHVEAGLRSFNRSMPEEINRIVVDRIARVLCAPCARAVDNLCAEGIVDGVFETGDIMYDAFLRYATQARERNVVSSLALKEGEYNLVTIHRASNTEDPEKFLGILEGLDSAEEVCVFPVHPRTRRFMADHAIDVSRFSNLRFIEPLGYLDCHALAASAKAIVTDSGGLQKEAYWHRVPCITVRAETEWVETVDAGWNCLVGSDTEKLARALAEFRPTDEGEPLYGDGNAAGKIVEAIEACLG